MSEKYKAKAKIAFKKYIYCDIHINLMYKVMWVMVLELPKKKKTWDCFPKNLKFIFELG